MSIQKKFLLALSLFILVFATVLGYAFRSTYNKALKEEFYDRGRLLASNLSYNAKFGLLMDDKENLAELIKGVMNEKDAKNVTFYSVSGQIVATSGDSIPFAHYQIGTLNLSTPQELQREANAVDFIATTQVDGETKGYTTVTLSLQNLQATLKKAALFAALVSVLFAGLAITVVMFITRYILKNLKTIKRFAEELADGQHGKTITMQTKDETGDLGRALNILSERIASTLAKSEENYHIAQESAHSLEENHTKALSEKKQLENWVMEILKILEKMKAGDLTSMVSEKMFGEIARVASAINLIILEFTEILSNIRSAGNSISTTSDRINTIGNKISAGAGSQYEQTDAMASAIEEMASSLENASRGMEHASEIAKQAHTSALDGGSVVQQAIKGINHIADVVGHSAKTVQSLGKQSEQINEIIQVIDEIADQTNLLALNAAIEAARAGEQGRGFAVVADEVRKLAERTSKATREIANMIEKILSLTGEAVKAMESGNSEMQNGCDLVENVGKALSEIVEAVDVIQTEFNRILETTREQSDAAAEISEQIALVRNIAKDNSENSSTIKAAGNELRQQINALLEFVSHFKISDAKNRDGSADFVGDFDKLAGSHRTKNSSDALANPPSTPSSYLGPDRRGSHTTVNGQKKITPEGRRRDDKGHLGVTTDGDIAPLK